jgi:hypothetical protein
VCVCVCVCVCILNSEVLLNLTHLQDGHGDRSLLTRLSTASSAAAEDSHERSVAVSLEQIDSELQHRVAQLASALGCV